jgi:hypothetical protein
MFFFQSVSSDQVLDNLSSLSVLPILESYNDHPMALEAKTPPIVSIIFGNLRGHDEFAVTVYADIIVSIIAL